MKKSLSEMEKSLLASKTQYEKGNIRLTKKMEEVEEVLSESRKEEGRAVELEDAARSKKKAFYKKVSLMRFWSEIGGIALFSTAFVLFIIGLILFGPLPIISFPGIVLFVGSSLLFGSIIFCPGIMFLGDKLMDRTVQRHQRTRKQARERIDEKLEEILDLQKNENLLISSFLEETRQILRENLEAEKDLKTCYRAFDAYRNFLNDFLLRNRKGNNARKDIMSRQIAFILAELYTSENTFQKEKAVQLFKHLAKESLNETQAVFLWLFDIHQKFIIPTSLGQKGEVEKYERDLIGFDSSRKEERNALFLKAFEIIKDEEERRAFLEQRIAESAVFLKDFISPMEDEEIMALLGPAPFEKPINRENAYKIMLRELSIVTESGQFSEVGQFLGLDQFSEVGQFLGVDQFLDSVPDPSTFGLNPFGLNLSPKLRKTLEQIEFLLKESLLKELLPSRPLLSILEY